MSNSPSYKIVFVGNHAVGKTTLIYYLIHNEWNSNTSPTVGCNYSEISYDTDGKLIKLNLWDTAGQEKSAAYSYMRNSHVIIICCDKERINTFTSWIDIAQNKSSTATILAVGCKSDLNVDSDDSTEIKERILEDERVTDFIWVSSKTGQNIDHLKRVIFESCMNHEIVVEDLNLVQPKPTEPAKCDC